MDKLTLDDWQSFFLVKHDHLILHIMIMPYLTMLPFNIVEQNLFESGNLGKAFRLISFPSSVTSLTPSETIALLQAQYPPRNIDSFTQAE